MIEKISSEAVKRFREKVDFVYIDGNHKYKYVKKDLENYYPLVKKGGVFGGHDFGNLEFQGVAQAVMEFCVKHNLKINVCDTDWFCINE